MVDIEKHPVGAFDQDSSTLVFHLLYEWHLVDDKRDQPRPILVKALDLLLDIILQKISISLLPAAGQCPQFSIHQVRIVDLAHPNTTSSRFCGVAWPNALFRRSYLSGA